MAAVAAAAADTADAGSGRLHRRLSGFGVLLLTLSCLSPVLSIYGVGPDVLKNAGTGAAGLFLVGVAAAVVWALVYAELGSAYPYSGGDYVGVGAILGPWAGFASLTVWAVTTGPATAFQAKVVASYLGAVMPGIAPQAAVFGALLAATVVALLAVRTSTIVTGVFLAIEMLAVLVLIAAGFAHPVRGIGAAIAHPVTLAANGRLLPVAAGALALGAVNAAFATAGGNQAIAFGEELRDPHRRMGPVILLAALVGASSIALPVIAVVIGARDLPAVLRSAAPFSAFVASVDGPRIGRALSAGVALAVFNALIAQTMFSARLFYSMGRDRVFGLRLSRWLSAVHPASGAPRAATLAVGALAAACCAASAHLLLVFSSGLVTYSLALVSLAVLVGRARRLTGRPGYWRAAMYPLAPVLGLALAGVFAVADLMDADAGRPSILLLGAVLVAGLLWHRFVLQRRPGGWRPLAS